MASGLFFVLTIRFGLFRSALGGAHTLSSIHFDYMYVERARAHFKIYTIVYPKLKIASVSTAHKCNGNVLLYRLKTVDDTKCSHVI